MNKKNPKPEEPGGEKVDGPGVAARILQAMDGGRQSRILEAIKRRDPTLSASIEEKLFNLDELLTLPPAHIPILIDAIDERDLLLALKTAGPELTAKLLSGMTARRSTRIKEEFQGLPKVRIADVTSAQKRILKTLSQLREDGKLPSPPRKDLWV